MFDKNIVKKNRKKYKYFCNYRCIHKKEIEIAGIL